MIAVIWRPYFIGGCDPVPEEPPFKPNSGDISFEEEKRRSLVIRMRRSTKISPQNSTDHGSSRSI